MEKDEFLKARVSRGLKADFEDICRTYDKQPTVQLRELVNDFVLREHHRLGDRVLINIFHPDSYDVGVWRVTIKLRDPQALVWCGEAIPFELPDLPKRRLSSDGDYLSVIVKPDGNCQMGGKFVEGMWRGHLYSNGCPETENPTPIENVRLELFQIVTKLLDRFGPRRESGHESA